MAKCPSPQASFWTGRWPIEWLGLVIGEEGGPVGPGAAEQGLALRGSPVEPAPWLAGCDGHPGCSSFGNVGAQQSHVAPPPLPPLPALPAAPAPPLQCPGSIRRVDCLALQGQNESSRSSWAFQVNGSLQSGLMVHDGMLRRGIRSFQLSWTGGPSCLGDSRACARDRESEGPGCTCWSPVLALWAQVRTLPTPAQPNCPLPHGQDPTG